MRSFDPIWQVKAGDEGRLRATKKHDETGQRAWLSRSEAAQARSMTAPARRPSSGRDARHARWYHDGSGATDTRGSSMNKATSP
jgi:hypothetical protein